MKEILEEWRPFFNRISRHNACEGVITGFPHRLSDTEYICFQRRRGGMWRKIYFIREKRRWIFLQGPWEDTRQFVEASTWIVQELRTRGGEMRTDHLLELGLRNGYTRAALNVAHSQLKQSGDITSVIVFNKERTRVCRMPRYRGDTPGG
jgi:hypothetical protein